SGYLSVTYYNVEAPADETTHLETLLQIDSSYSGTGDASGTITDAFTGSSLSGVDVSLRSGVNSYTGTVVAQTTTDGSGDYSFTGLDAGHYTAEIEKSDYTTAYFTLFVLGGETTTGNNSSMTPNLASGEIRIILDWGQEPSDLDSHTTGPIEGSSDRFHIYYSVMGDESSSPYTELDVDDVTSYGPETTTIYQQFSGDYFFYVHDYSNRYATSSTDLANSGARVRVYFGSSLERTFYVPSGDGTLWKVFKLDETTITPINQMMYESSPSGVSARSVGTLQDESGLFEGLPRK
ncbi:MAG: carboxypeptidase regulatory-like domain-containing protein, partial [Nanoarchaeota archaeon]